MIAEHFWHSAPMSSQSQHYAARVLAAFRKAGLYTDDEIKAAGGPSSSTMTKIRKAAEDQGWIDEPRGDTHRRIDLAARWRPGSSRELWHHGEAPTQRGETVDDAEEVRRSNLHPGTKVRLLAMLEAGGEPGELRRALAQQLRDRGLEKYAEAEAEAETSDDDTPASGSA